MSLSSIVDLPLDSCAVPSAFKTSVITKNPFFLSGSGYIATGLSKQSEEPPGAWRVEEPSKDHIGQLDNFPSKSDTIFVLLLRL